MSFSAKRPRLDGAPPLPQSSVVTSLEGLAHLDAILVVSPFVAPLSDPAVAFLNADIDRLRALDKAFTATPTLTAAAGTAIKRVIFSPVAALTRDYDDGADR